ncbi:M24 family metallopeptidase [Oceanibacterium hippocampi]|uniref:Putative peptidase n=1 Tax=Oceanibacterium hippocampi TaxID=745714 RepID=A0A1Y5TIS9_9PROT|nr:Xaa-Pro peptidase family protein [Oceanibacterium hippocampi]SLN64886.1 putative peptidase [Oceanibacterium hippocampi]
MADIAHFPPAEFAARQARAVAAMAEEGLDALVLFKQDSRYYLTGYDSGAHTYFQCLLLTGDGDLALLSRLPDLRQARITSDIPDIRVWLDGQGQGPGEMLRDLLAEKGLAEKRLGVERDCFGMTAFVWRQLAEACGGFCDLVDASRLVDGLRAAKTPAEIALTRAAAARADQAIATARSLARPDVEEALIVGRMQADMLRAGGMPAAWEPVIGSGPEAAAPNGHSGRRVLAEGDPLFLGLAGSSLRYHAGIARTLVLAPRDRAGRELFERVRAAQETAAGLLRPGVVAGDVAAVDAGDGVRVSGHGLGAIYAPSEADWPYLRPGEDACLPAGACVYLEAAIRDLAGNRVMVLGDSFLVGEAGAERLTRASQAPEIDG